MFKFRLQRVLELREKHEEARAIELARAEASASAARLERDQLQAMRSASREQITSANASDPTVGHLHHLGFVLNALDSRLVQATKTVTNAEDVVTDARRQLESAARDRRVLDRLKDKHSDIHRAGEAQQDRLLMDEIALTLFTRQRLADQRTPSADAAADDGSNTTQIPDGAAAE
ncbi:MAG: flagellar export protein FliJ [Gemmatimonas sp.]